MDSPVPDLAGGRDAPMEAQQLDALVNDAETQLAPLRKLVLDDFFASPETAKQ